jgi:NDP-sugar pyrophosphorylase family protein
VLHARTLLDGDEPFLLHNADIVTDADLRPLLRDCEAGAFASLLVMRRDTRRALVFDAAMHLLGKQVWAEEGAEYPADAPRLAFCGVHAVSPAIFRCGYPEGFSDIFDIYRRALAQGARITGCVHDGLWSDLGSVEKIRAYERMTGSAR